MLDALILFQVQHWLHITASYCSLFWFIVSECKSKVEDRSYKDDEGEQQLVESEQGVVEEYREESNSLERAQRISLDNDLKRTCQTDNSKIESHLRTNASGETGLREIDIDQCGAHISKFRNDIRKLKQQYRDQLTKKCYQLKIQQTKDDDLC